MLVSIAACGSEDDEPGLDATGGYTGAGANTSTGGLVASGGAGGAQIGSGGAISTGGFTPGNGGIMGAGGGPETGGTSPGTGGTDPGTGGDPGSGGTGNGGAGGSNGGAGGSNGGSGGGNTTGPLPKHGDPPSAPTSARGPYTTQTLQIAGAGCVHYPTNAEAPFAAVVISDGAGGSGGCNSIQTGQWGPLYASWGIVAMIITTTGGDQPEVRGRKLTAAIAAFKTENGKAGSPLMGKLAGRYGSSGFSMGGGGTTRTAAGDPTLLTNVPIMPWRPVAGTSITVPSLYICGQSDNIASCNTHGTPSFNALPDSTPQMKVTVSGGHNGQPTAGGGESGQAGLAFQKVFLEGDERWRPLLKRIQADSTNIQ